jgi:hypothetical protein
MHTAHLDGLAGDDGVSEVEHLADAWRCSLGSPASIARLIASL